MKFKTFRIVAGSEACNAGCPFCVSKMTPPNGLALKEPEINWRNFKIAGKLARDYGADTAMITGKGEPLLDLPQSGRIYDIDGQNICLTNCLTRITNPEDGRHLIFFPDGHIRYDWEKEGAILL